MIIATETVGVAQQLVSFGEAVKALKEGKRVQRKGWNGKDLFIFRQVPSSVPGEVIPKMTSLPESVKKVFEKRGSKTISYQNQLAMVYPDNRIFGWVASPSDILEEDWVILD